MPKSFTEDGAFGAGGSNTGGYNDTPTGGGSWTSDDSGGMLQGEHAGLLLPQLGGGESMQPWGTTLAPGQSSQHGNNIFTNRSNSGEADGFGGTLQPGGFNPAQVQQDMLGMPGGGHFGGYNGTPSNVNLSGMMFEDGGEVPGMGFDPMAGMRSDLMDRIAAARASVTGALDFGRKQNGLQELAGLNRMPTTPGDQSESGIPRDRPMPGPLPPTSNPFGRRADAGGQDGMDTGEGEMGFNPSQSESGIPRPTPNPGTLPAPANPFGRRKPYQVSEGEQEPGADEQTTPQVASAIPETDDEEAA